MTLLNTKEMMHGEAFSMMKGNYAQIGEDIALADEI